MDNTTVIRYIVSVLFAVLVFALGFYALVIYEFALPELIQGAFISMMTLAVQYVFGEQLATSVSRRAQANFESGMNSQPTVTTTTDPTTVTVGTPPPVVESDPLTDDLGRPRG
jgi:cation transporter-like permease